MAYYTSSQIIFGPIKDPNATGVFLTIKKNLNSTPKSVQCGVRVHQFSDPGIEKSLCGCI
jgi:hypothetical protein